MGIFAKTIGCAVALVWLQNVGAGEVVISEQGGSIVLSVEASADSVQPASTVAGQTIPVSAPAAIAGVQSPPPAQGVPVTRLPVKAYYERVDRANIEKRMDDRATRTMRRNAEAAKDAAERAAKVQLNQTQQ